MIASSVLSRMSRILSEFADNWRQFLLIHVVVHALIIVLLVPASTLLLQFSVWFSGDVVISDEDILRYIFSPSGSVLAIFLLALFSIIVFLEYAALLIAAHLNRSRQEVRVLGVLRILATHLVRLFRLAVQVLVRVVVNSLPFLVLIIIFYWVLLTDYDINFYLSTKPAEWYLALALSGVVVLCWAVRLLYLMTVWAYCLPLVLFTPVSPWNALSESRKLTLRKRLDILRSLVAWLVFSAVLAAVAAFLTAIAADLLVPASVDSMRLLLVVMSVVSLWSFLLSFAVTFTSTAVLSLLLLELYSSSQSEEQLVSPAGDEKLDKHEIILGSRVLVATLVAGLLVSSGMAYNLLNQIQNEDSTVVVAHRGASFAAPENTLAAVKAAIESGAEWVEIDVQETSDGAVVVIHDRDLKKVGRNSMVVAKSTLQELQQVDVGSWFAPQFSAERIPTLAEVLEYCRGRIGVNIELKYYGAEILLEQRVVEIVERTGMVDEVVLMSLKPGAIREIRRLRPEWTVGLLTSVALGNLAAMDVDFIAINARFASRQLVRSLHKQDKEILVWTVNDAAGMSAMATRGVDGIITDEPALAVSLLEQRKELEPAERLLMQLAEIFQKPSLNRQQ